MSCDSGGAFILAPDHARNTEFYWLPSQMTSENGKNQKKCCGMSLLRHNNRSWTGCVSLQVKKGMRMGPVLNGLVKLQRVENRLRAVKTKLARCRRGVLFQENQLRTLQNGLEAKLEEIKQRHITIDARPRHNKTRD